MQFELSHMHFEEIKNNSDFGINFSCGITRFIEQITKLTLH